MLPSTLKGPTLISSVKVADLILSLPRSIPSDLDPALSYVLLVKVVFIFGIVCKICCQHLISDLFLLE